MSENKKILSLLIAFITLIVVGTIGYSFLLKISLMDALYMTIITISTVGYGEVAQMTADAKIFSILIIFWGVGIGGYTFTSIVVMLVEGKIKDAWRNKIMENKISNLKDHYILCGAGETGEVIIEQFEKKGVDFVVIEKSESRYQELQSKNILTVLGDCTEEEILEKAEIKNARGLITSLSKDAENIFTVLTAREMNEDLYIISRSIDKNAPSKLKKAGANNTISSNQIGGRRMAALMIRPSVISFLDVITRVGDIELDLEDVLVNKGSYIDGKSLKEIQLPQKVGLNVLGIKKYDSTRMYFNPDPDEPFEEGDTLLVLGTGDQVNELRKLANDKEDRLPSIGSDFMK